MPVLPPKGDPYCSACGYRLSGLTDSAKCPECGRPIVDVLVRDTPFAGRRWQSQRKVGDLPLVSIAFGPAAGERHGHPCGVIAIGDYPVGWLAIGAFARGGIAIGGFALGGISIGGVSAGALAIGGTAIGGITLGAISIGIVAVGSLVIAAIKGWGAVVWRLL